MSAVILRVFRDSSRGLLGTLGANFVVYMEFSELLLEVYSESLEPILGVHGVVLGANLGVPWSSDKTKQILTRF